MKPSLILLAAFLFSCQADTLPPAPPAAKEASELSKAARGQIGVTTIYDPAYVSMKYPGGDIPRKKGVCTDVVIRALRTKGADLQRLVHEDMKQNFSKYPKIWGLKRPDRNIDHRRVPNLRTFFKRRGIEKEATKNPRDYLAGDFVTCLVPGNRPHIMIVSDERAVDGTPLVIHNIGSGVTQHNWLFDFKITGHYRWFEKK
jgi:uncharacterized protein YijF (DUF1287 family)